MLILPKKIPYPVIFIVVFIAFLLKLALESMGIIDKEDEKDDYEEDDF